MAGLAGAGCGAEPLQEVMAAAGIGSERIRCSTALAPELELQGASQGHREHEDVFD